MSDDEDPIGSGHGFDNAGGVFGGNEGEEDNGKMEERGEDDGDGDADGDIWIFEGQLGGHICIQMGIDIKF